MTLGRGLLSLVDPRNDRNLIHQMGWLRKEIHRQLSRNKDIKFFEDARKEKFGFGATLVRLK